MPNYCYNVVRAPKEVLDDLYKNKKITFEKLIPMPKSLNLTEGSRTENAVLYAVLKKDFETRSKLIKVLSNVHEYIDHNYWNKLVNRFALGTPNGLLKAMEKLDREAKVFCPDEDERKLKINSLEELGNTYLNNLLKYKSMTWYDWCINNWGTKWDAFECEGSPEEEELRFTTAWSPPEKVIVKLFTKHSDKKIEWEYETEGDSERGIYFSDEKGNIKLKKTEIERKEEEDEEEI